MAYERVRAYAVQLLERQPDPPRHVKRQEIVSILADKVSGLSFLFGLFGLIVTGYIWISPAYAHGEVLLTFMTMPGTLLFLGIPLWLARKWQYALAKGRLGYARIVSISGLSSSSTASFDALQHGTLSGWWEVEVDRIKVTAAFKLDQPWAARLWVGSSVRVLLHPSRPKILLPIGP